jgi:glycosyltransferase involved in cell wall biosynthesis
MLSPVAPAHGKGGVQDIVWSLATGLAARGHAVTLFTTSRTDGVGVGLELGVDVRYVAGTPPMRATGTWEGATRKLVAELHRRTPLDVIHSQSFCGLHLIGALPGVPVVASLHGTHVDEMRTMRTLFREGLAGLPRVSAARDALRAVVVWWWMRGRFAREGARLRHADGVIATSREQRAILARDYAVPEARLHDVWNGIDVAAFAPAPRTSEALAQLGAEDGHPLVLAVARLYQDKGIQHLLRAWPRVRARVPGAALAVVGDGPYRATLEALRDELGLGASARFAGAAPFAALPALYAACDVFVNPTVRINGYDLTILQAMAAERPVVVSNIGSVPTAVADGVDGVLVPPGDAAALADALVALLGDAPRRAALGAAARRTVVERFSLDAMVEGTLAVYLAARREVPA